MKIIRNNHPVPRLQGDQPFGVSCKNNAKIDDVTINPRSDSHGSRVDDSVSSNGFHPMVVPLVRAAIFSTCVLEWCEDYTVSHRKTAYFEREAYANEGDASYLKRSLLVQFFKIYQMKLYVPIPCVFRFQPIFDESEWLQKVLTQDTRTMSVWYIEDECDMDELRRILVGNQHKLQD